MHATPLTITLALWLTLLLPSSFALPSDPPSPSPSPSQPPKDLPKTSFPQAVWQMCVGGENATIVHSSAPVHGSEGLVLTTGLCINNGTNSTIPAPTPPPKANDDEGPSVGARGWCPTINTNNCQSRFSGVDQNSVLECSASCSSSCFPLDSGGPGPDPNDCQQVSNNLYRESVQIFTLEPENFIFFTRGSCGIGIKNQIAANPANWGCSQRLTYDYTDLADVGHYLAWNCQAQQAARGGICVADRGVYTNVPDFFIQVYAI